MRTNLIKFDAKFYSGYQIVEHGDPNFSWHVKKPRVAQCILNSINLNNILNENFVQFCLFCFHFISLFSNNRKLKKKQERICKKLYNRLLEYPECQRVLGLPVYRPLFDSNDLWTNNDSLIDWSYINGTIHATIEANRTATNLLGNEMKPVLPALELWQSIMVALIIAVCMILTIGGNILVLLAFIVDRSIRQPSNYFIASLAATDILIGVYPLEHCIAQCHWVNGFASSFLLHTIFVSFILLLDKLNAFLFQLIACNKPLKLN